MGPMTTVIGQTQSPNGNTVPMVYAEAVVAQPIGNCRYGNHIDRTGVGLGPRPGPPLHDAPLYRNHSSHSGRVPESYTALAWFSCLCCCWPGGLVAVCAS